MFNVGKSGARASLTISITMNWLTNNDFWSVKFEDINNLAHDMKQITFHLMELSQTCHIGTVF